MNNNLHAKLALSVRNENLAKEYANKLICKGFRIIQIAPRGISFEGPIEMFEKVFNCKIKVLDSSIQFIGKPSFPDEISQGVESIYFPTKPTYFDQSFRSQKA